MENFNAIIGSPTYFATFNLETKEVINYKPIDKLPQECSASFDIEWNSESDAFIGIVLVRDKLSKSVFGLKGHNFILQTPEKRIVF